MLLALDIGNTNVVAGVFDGEALRHQWRLQTDRRRTADEWGLLFRQLFAEAGLRSEDVTGVIVSSVVPPVMPEIERFIVRAFGVAPLIVGPGIRTGLKIQIDNPRELGADRVTNAVAAVHHYGPPLIVVDFGTATTFCLIDETGTYRGGVIAPGVMVAMEALVQNAAKLPKVELVPPPDVVGKNTVEALQSGLFYGYLSLVEGMIERLKRRFSVPPTVVATGGLAEPFARSTKRIDVYDPQLTLKGLKRIYDLNAASSPPEGSA
ncbi:MAG: type III pantothenate kinase [Hydrogenibacillus schlegelii]|uniref:Type III pantothenate kinase n=1 Tax=Hydrogenibacillus schlegelii TaxID=1484 RepID=A0A947CYT5_HYDSH|nr:type III pantothenate kinase [Hydrogenibacillus schlegelii]